MAYLPIIYYSGIYAFEKDVTDIDVNWGKMKKLSFSFTAGVYESKSTSTSLSSDSGMIYRDGNSYFKKNIPPNKVGYPYYRALGSITTATSVQSIGLFFSPHLRLNLTPTEQDGWHIYLSFNGSDIFSAIV